MDARDIPRLETARLRLRALERGDFPAFAAMWADPQVVRFIGGTPLARDAAWMRFLQQMGMWHYLGFGALAIESRATGAFLGVVGCHDLLRDIEPSIEGSMEVGWVLTTAAWGQGIAEEAMRAVFAWADRVHAGRRMTCIIDPDHLASLRVASKLGFAELARTTYKDGLVVVLERGAGTAAG